MSPIDLRPWGLAVLFCVGISAQTQPAVSPAPIPPAETVSLQDKGAPVAEPQATDTALSPTALAAQPALAPSIPQAAALPTPIRPTASAPQETSQAMRIVLGLTVLALLPALLICVTSFLRTIIVLSMLRHAVGMPETPPNTALTGLALFLTLFIMAPTLQRVNQEAFQPFMAGQQSLEVAFKNGAAPLREFMVRQTREEDLALMVELSKAKPPQTMEEISNVQLIPAFMLSELRAAFQIGFVIFLPFLLIDLVVSSILMSLGMMMIPPTTISLPFKILMFVLIDGWSLLLKALVGSFH